MTDLYYMWFADVWTVLRKELRELTVALGVCRSTLVVFVLSTLLIGTLLVWCAAAHWSNSLLALVVWLLAPVLPTTVAVAESFAGEREHGTFESLLATPLSPFALLAGKVAAATFFGWMATVAAFLVATGVAHFLGMPTPVAAVAGQNGGALLALSFLSAAFMASAGSYVVAHVATVRQAYARLGWLLALLAVTVAVFLLAVDGPLPQPGHALRITSDAEITPLSLLGLVLLGADATLYAAAALHFRRKQLLTE